MKTSFPVNSIIHQCEHICDIKFDTPDNENRPHHYRKRARLIQGAAKSSLPSRPPGLNEIFLEKFAAKHPAWPERNIPQKVRCQAAHLALAKFSSKSSLPSTQYPGPPPAVLPQKRQKFNFVSKVLKTLAKP